MKSVLIVGGGPAGLVAAKTLLHHTPGQFKVTVFEAAPRVGGIWRVRKDEQGHRCSPDMRTNLSKFGVAFSDLSWESVDWSDCTPDSKAPIFPKAWQVGRYLEEYSKRYIPQESIHCNRAVVSADQTGSAPLWEVTSVDQSSKETYHDSYDCLIVASGIHDQPGTSLSRIYKSSPAVVPKVQHSALFRDVSSFGSEPGNIVVIGGGISGSEAAATAAFQLSSAKHTPGPKPAWASSKVYHITNKPFYCLSRYLPEDPYDPSTQSYKPAPQFLPDDFVMYNLTRRGKEAITAINGRVPPEKAKQTHEWIRSIIGGNQRDIGRPEIVFAQEQTHLAAYNGITETYAEFVRSGSIIPIRGRASEFEGSEGGAETFTLSVVPSEPWRINNHPETKVDNVVGVVDATGFDASLPYLSDRIRVALEQDTTNHRIPFLLTRGSVFNPNVVNIGFVGFYEGPFWGTMEMQSRSIARRWAGGPSDEAVDRSQLQDMKKLRQAMNERADDVAQFWAGDFVGLVEDFARELNIVRNDDGFDGQKGPVFGARYATADCTQEEVQKTTAEIHRVLEASKKEAKFVAAAAFRAMQGKWILQRGVRSRSPHSPGGSLKGTAHFHPRTPTSEEYAGEYLYIEEGTFTMDNGYSFPATRRYVYRYNEFTDKISAWFVKEDGESVERFFNRMDFQAPPDPEKGWIAKGSHWCDPDQYNSGAEFRFRGSALQTFGITYDVVGPKKDYTMESWYTRPAPDA